MPVNTADQQITLPIGGDAADNPQAFLDFVADLESRLVKRYVDAADRTARNAAPVAGELSYLANPGRWDRWTGAAWWEAFDLYAEKTAEAQTANNTTVFVNDTHLVLPMQINARYSLEGLFLWDSGTTGDIKFDWTGPAGFTMPLWSMLALDTAVAFNPSFSQAAGTAIAEGGRGIGTFAVGWLRGTVVTVGTAGNLQLRWTQNAAEAVNTRLKTASWVRLKRVG